MKLNMWSQKRTKLETFLNPSMLPGAQMASIIVKWKKYGKTRSPPRAGPLAKLNNQTRRALVREVSMSPLALHRDQRTIVKILHQ